MTKDMLLQIFMEGTSGKNHLEGQRVCEEDLVSFYEIAEDEDIVKIQGEVISEDLFSKYNVKIELDPSVKSIVSVRCTCGDYEKNSTRKRNYGCKHIAAVFYKSLEELSVHSCFNNGVYVEEKDFLGNNILNMLIGENEKEEEIKLEVYLNRNSSYNILQAEFRIGLSSMASGNLNVLRDINAFLAAFHDRFPIEYSKGFTFDIRVQKIKPKNRQLIDFIEVLKNIDRNGRQGIRLVDGKYINIPDYLLRDFFEIIKKHKIYLNEGFFSRIVQTEILEENPAINIKLDINDKSYELRIPDGMPMILDSRSRVMIYGTSIYLPDYDYSSRILTYARIFNNAECVQFSLKEEDRILRRLIPELNLLSPYTSVSDKIKSKIVTDKVKFRFYFDQEDGRVILVLKVVYGAYEFNIFGDCCDKVIYRDTHREQQVLQNMKALGFEEVNEKLMLLRDEEYIFTFFRYDIQKLQEIGEVFYSENFKGIRQIGSKGLRGEVKPGKFDYFQINFSIDNIPSEEIGYILRAFRNDMKYYRLKSGEFIDLKELELKKLLKLMDSVAPEDMDGSSVYVDNRRSSFIGSYIQDEGIRYIKGRKSLTTLQEKMERIKELHVAEPEGFRGELRPYQKTGYRWMKIIEELGFGGVLGDEMGLGKTLQAITYILSSKGRHTLIVVPASLIYNWLSEFKKFAPELRVELYYGAKEIREEKLNDIRSIDVIITTYTVLRIDMDKFEGIEFDCCIIDEAQNIKNPGSQNAAAVKAVKAKTRFALSGTPMENSLMDLWSIFDFIMPGYLYDEKRFNTRYCKGLKESSEVKEELVRLVRPFILRRTKSEVLSELPEKIERIIPVSMEDEQKKAYKVYADYAVSVIENKIRSDEFKKSKIEILSYITKLRQLCLTPEIVMEGYEGGSAKLEALMELLRSSIEEGHKILVFSQFTSVLKVIGKRLEKEEISYSYIDGGIPAAKRLEIVDDFNEGDRQVFLISLKAGGTGLNITSADIVVHFDPWWNPAAEDQAADRAHRIGQKNVVEVIRIIAEGTIEEKIINLQVQKKRLISEITGSSLDEIYEFDAMSGEDVLMLFKAESI